MLKRQKLYIAGGFVGLTIMACSNSPVKKEQAQLHLNIGTGYLSAGKNPQALSELLTAEQLDPTDPVIQNNLGLAYYFRKEYPMAESHMKKALELYPKYSDARNNLGRMYIDLSRYDEAISVLSVVAKDLTYPNPEKVYLNLGLAYLKKASYDSALNSFKKSMESNVRFCPAYNYYGQTLFQQQKYSEAIDSFEQALALCNNNYDEAHYYSALSYYKSGQTEKALARMEEVESRYPTSVYAAKAKNMLKIIR